MKKFLSSIIEKKYKAKMPLWMANLDQKDNSLKTNENTF